MSYSVIKFEQITDPEDRKNIEFLRTVTEKCKKQLIAAGATRFAGSAGRTTSNEFNVDGGKFSLFRTQFSDSLSLTCYIGDKKGTASVSSSLTVEENISSAVNDAIASAKAAEPDPDWVVAPKEENKIFLSGSTDFDKDLFFNRTVEAMEEIKRRYPLIIMEQAIANHGRSCNVYFNSSGTEFITISGSYVTDFMYSAHDGDNASSFVGNEFCLESLDKPFLDVGYLAKTLENTEKQIYTTPFKGKKVGKLIATPGLVSEFLSTALDDFTGDYNILNGTSIWLNKLGQQVADPRLTVSLKTNDSRFVGGQAYTGEGFLTEDYNIIDKGILTAFSLSAYVASKTGKKRAPNSGENMVVEKGSKSIEDIIKETEFGIYVARFSGGEPAVNGDFSGVAKNSFLVENGKITVPLSETMISGNLADLLNNVVDISSEQEITGSEVIPYICFDGVTISGE